MKVWRWFGGPNWGFEYERKAEVSICIPTLHLMNGRVSRLADSLQQHTSVDYELVVADCCGEELGYTRPANLAMAEGSAPLLLSMNDDIEVTPDWIDPLLDEAQHGTWCCTPDATHTDGPQVFAPYCMLWHKRAWEEIGGLDERFVLWGSDIDLAKRLVDAHHRPARIKLPIPIKHQLNATVIEGDWGRICTEDLQRFREKWGISAEEMKAQLTQAHE